MSATTCARSGGAVLFRCLADRDAYWPLAQMQRDMERIAAGPSSARRLHRKEIERAKARRHR